MAQKSPVIESQACPACNQSGVRYRFSAPGDYGLAKCGDCGLVRTEPMPDEEFLAKFYQGFRFLEPSLDDLFSEVERVTASLEHFIGRAKDEASFLDFGGGGGIYCLAAAKLGYEASLFEVDRPMADFARQKMGVKRVFTQLDELAGRRFSVILACHVIEHVRDPNAFIAVLRDFLHEDGVILLATPNAATAEKYVRPRHMLRYLRRLRGAGAGLGEALGAVMARDSVFCWDAPRHLLAFTPASLRRLGENSGFLVETFTGYNTEAMFEPRGYVLPPVTLRVLLRPGAWPDAMSRLLMPLVRWLHPSGGEQLYATLRRAAAPATGSATDHA